MFFNSALPFNVQDEILERACFVSLYTECNFTMDEWEIKLQIDESCDGEWAILCSACHPIHGYESHIIE